MHVDTAPGMGQQPPPATAEHSDEIAWKVQMGLGNDRMRARKSEIHGQIVHSRVRALFVTARIFSHAGNDYSYGVLARQSTLTNPSRPSSHTSPTYRGHTHLQTIFAGTLISSLSSSVGVMKLLKNGMPAA